ncbi:glutamate-1-semialdehyde 2,1-aminomutase [Algisphaera agarilytica]|uniref:Glutamate-1-semialdehyde 2,1-aminomutase n=1 Tax=Algisphaera agarilytica TaxID=1385975 RepID=A0A7X0H472_9BACT|nr:glutamate-1-semialdehyde 2,1-aminomutase [Algisphaera agarilytica]MBB6428773.1 glutamate-1-semialdehyde 2,1-aminomutase [Algisphaera agarilytica]
MSDIAPSAPSTDRYTKSAAAHARARKVMPGGVSSPVRAYKAVGREPVTVVSGQGACVTDIDGNEYVDYVCSYGPLILGHAAPEVSSALAKAAQKGTSFGMPTEAETVLAEKIVDAVPGVEVVRFVNSGTEAAMSAIRLARAASGKNNIIKCTGCYHGHTDSLLVSAGSAATTLGVPSSPGVPQSVTEHTLLVPFNDLDAVRAAMQEHGSDIAAMAVEPIAGNMGCVPPAEGYLQGLRDLCDEFGIYLLFDEVMTGFRVDYGGAQKLYGVTPDLVCLGKVVGGGLPCAAYGGKEEVMRQVAPDGAMYQAGTLSGNPLAMAAGTAMLDSLAADDFAVYAQLEATAATLEAGLREAAAEAGCPIYLTRVGSMLCPFFVDAEGDEVHNYADATATRTDRYAAFFGTMLDEGVMLAPAAFEAWFVSTAHDEQAISQTLAAARKAFAAAAAIA